MFFVHYRMTDPTTFSYIVTQFFISPQLFAAHWVELGAGSIILNNGSEDLDPHKTYMHKTYKYAWLYYGIILK
jgi:hypothetical protein